MPWNGERQIKLDVVACDASGKVHRIAYRRISYPKPDPLKPLWSQGGVEFLETDSAAPWGKLAVSLEFGAGNMPYEVNAVRSPIMERAAGSPLRGLSPIRKNENEGLKQGTINVDTPYTLLNVYCFFGAGWDSLRTEKVKVVVGVGSAGILCEEVFQIAQDGNLSVQKAFQLKYEKQRLLRIAVIPTRSLTAPDQPSEEPWKRDATFADIDLANLMNGCVVSCRQQLSFYRLDSDRCVGYMEIETEFSTARGEPCVRHIESRPSQRRPAERLADSLTSPWLNPSFSPFSSQSNGSPMMDRRVDHLEAPMSLFLSELDMQVPSGNREARAVYSSVRDMRTLLMEVTAVSQLPHSNDLCAVHVGFGTFYSATGVYHSSSPDLRAPVFELHRMPYHRERYAQVVLRVTSSTGVTEDGHGWLDLAEMPHNKEVWTRLVIRNERNFLGHVFMRLAFLPESTRITTPQRLGPEEIKQSVPLVVLASKETAAMPVPSLAPLRPAPAQTSVALCSQSPLASPRGPETSMDWRLKRLLETSEKAAVSAPAELEHLEAVVLQLAGFCDLPSLDEIKSLRLQFVLRAGERATMVSKIMPPSSPSPDYKDLAFRIPLMGLRFITLDVLDRTMRDCPVCIGRVTFDSEEVGPNGIVAGHMELQTEGQNGKPNPHAYCLYAMEGIAQGTTAGWSRPSPQQLQLEETELPLYRHMVAQSATQTPQPDPIKYTNSTLCVRLISVTPPNPLPFPYGKTFISVLVTPLLATHQEPTNPEEASGGIASEPIELNTHKQTSLNKLISLPTEPFKALKFSLLASSPIQQPIELDSHTLSLRFLDTPHDTIIEFARCKSVLKLSVSRLAEPCRGVSCQGLRMPITATQRLGFPSALMAAS
eukprot:Protomagalhaensia_sp_Gyna_25__5103@NODE_588_length_3055_cov_113_691976_g455_i0_p1_GENE_NODE_588_length_3055_cov_113_691976_g455_i0NODE_588_length_3055_cov_113_691976_g455_i0_p1_ORF_typecomplete_len947_score149_31_NODE_588_length_3055_cov_113_691976_g455_i02132846